MAVWATRATRGASEHVRSLADVAATLGWNRRTAWVLVGALGALAVVAAVFLPEDGLPWLAWDSRTYWEAARSADPYEHARVGAIGAYLYSPAFLQALRPAVLMPWPLFLYLWAAATIAVAWKLVAGRGLPRRWLVVLGVLALLDVWAGNINVFLAGAVVVGLRWPAAWAFMALTKASPFLGVAWFAARHEWRKLGVAVAVTAAVAVASALVDPEGWRDWVSVLLSSNQVTHLDGNLPIPALVRFPAGLALAWWGGRTDRPWVMPIAVLLFLPVIWPNGFALLVACAALARWPTASTASATAHPGPSLAATPRAT